MILHQTDRVTLYHADARDVLPTRFVHELVTDPPYGMEWQSGRRAETLPLLAMDGSSDEHRRGVAEILGESLRVLEQRRHAYVFGPTDVLAGLPVCDPVELVWDKMRPGMGDLAERWAPAHEVVTFATNLFGHTGEVGQGPTLPARIRKGSVLSFRPLTGRAVRHPSEKPVGLLRELVESSSGQGEVVLDPFAGVGSVGVAAVLSGRRCVLVEIDHTYAMIARDRLVAAERLADRMAAL